MRRMTVRRYLAVLAVFLLLAAGCSPSGKEGAPAAPAAGAGPQTAGDAARTPEGSTAGAGLPSLQVGNSAPEIRHVWFVGGDGKPGNTLGVESEAYDADGDAIQVGIAWRKNGEAVGAGSRLPVPVKRDDNVAVTLTPSDGKATGRPVTLSRVILNTPPGIEGHEQFRFDENVATFHVLASDADEDPLAFALKDAPAGMSIDRKTGMIRWAVSPGTTGKVPFTVEVIDPSGGTATARFTVTIAEQPRSDAK